MKTLSVSLFMLSLLACRDAVEETETASSTSESTTTSTLTQTTSTSETGTATTTTTPTETGTSTTTTTLKAVSDYAQEGNWTAGQVWGETTGSSGNQLYISTWYPSMQEGESQTVYGWTGFWNTGESFTDVSPDCAEPRPVFMYSHGYGGVGWEMFYLPEFLATHGWVVSAPDHTGNTIYDGTGDFNQVVARRPVDIKESFDWLVAQSNDEDSGMYGCVDESAGYAVGGFSFGGYTAYATAGALVNNNAGTPTHDYSDDRAWGVVTFAPWYAYYLTTGTSEIDIPVMSIGGDRDDTVGTDYKTLHSSITSTPRILGSLPNAGHMSYTPIYCWSNGNGCGPDYVDQDALVEVLKTSVTSWLEYIRGVDGALEQLPEFKGELIWDLVEE